MKSTFINPKIILLLIALFISHSQKVQPQSPVDSIDIYNPFTNKEDLRRIVKNHLSIVSDENKSLLNNYALQIEKAKLTNLVHDEINGLLNSANIYFKSALYSIALNYYLNALELYVSINDEVHAGYVQIEIGRNYYFSDLVPLAREYITKGYNSIINSKDDELKAYAYYAIATIEEDNEKAKVYYKVALNIQREIINKRPDEYKVKENFARYLNGNGYTDEAMKLSEEIGNKWMTVLYLNNIGLEKYTEGKYTESLEYFTKSVKICKEAKLKGLLKNTYVNLGVLYRLMGDWKKSATYAEIAQTIVESLYADEISVQTAEMIVRYKTEKKELENELLLQQQEIMKDNINDKTRLNYLLGATILFISFFSAFVFISRRNIKAANKLLDKQKNEIYEQKEILESLNESLLKSETNLNLAQSSAHVANWDWDLSTDKITFSNELARIYGVDEEKLKLDTIATILEKIHPDDKEQYIRYFDKNFIDRQNEIKEYRIIVEGNEKWVRAKRISMADETGKVTKVFGIVQDITETKKNEEEKILLASQQSFTRQLIISQEEERKRIAGELHDSIGQDTILIRNMAQLGLQVENQDPFTIEQLTHINNYAGEMINIVREIAFDLRPAHLERLGLTETLISLGNRVFATTKIIFSHNIDDIDNLFNSDAEINIYRIIQESFNNIVKHSDAKNVEVNIFKAKTFIIIELKDDGKGFDIESTIEKIGGFGLNNILNRIKILSGTLVINSTNQTGTQLTINIPMLVQ